MGYEKWERKLVSPNSIDLDPDNPRLPGLSANSSQDVIRREMFDAGKVKEMIQSIAKSGFFPEQSIVVVRKSSGRGFIVLEGNRRICACQALLKPKKVPEKYARFVEKWLPMAELVKASFEKVQVVIAPDRSSATRLIVSRHLNQAPVRRWSRFAQGKFAIKAFESGQDLEFVIEETGLSESNIRKAIQESRLFDLFLGMDWTVEEKEVLLDNIDSFPIEALSRVLKSPATKNLFGEVEFNKDGWAEFHWEKEKIHFILKRLVRDALPALSGEKQAALNSRTTNKKDDVEIYLNNLPDEIKPQKSESVTLAENLIEKDSSVSKVEGSDEGSVKPVIRKRRSAQRKTPALSADIECVISNDKAKALLEELQLIQPEKHVYGTALLLRTLLEISLISRMRVVSTWADCLSVNTTGKGQIPSLDKLLKYAASCDKTLPDHNLRKAVANSNLTPRVFLNIVAHNDQHALTASEVREVATRMTPLLRFLLNPKTDGHGG